MPNCKYYPQNVEALSNEEIAKNLHWHGYRDDHPDCAQANKEYSKYTKEAFRVLDSRNIDPIEKLKLAKIGGEFGPGWYWFFDQCHDLTPYSTAERQAIIDEIHGHASLEKFVSHGNFELADDLYLLKITDSRLEQPKAQTSWLVKNFIKKYPKLLTEEFLLDLIYQYSFIAPEIFRLGLLSKEHLIAYVDRKIKSPKYPEHGLVIERDDHFFAGPILQGTIDLERAIALCVTFRKHTREKEEDDDDEEDDNRERVMIATAKKVIQSDYPVEKIVDIAGKINSSYFNIELLKNRELVQKLNGEQILALTMVTSGDEFLSERLAMTALDTKKLNFEQRYAILERFDDRYFALDFMAKGYGLPDPQ